MASRAFVLFRSDQCPPQYFPNCGGAGRHPILKSEFINGGKLVGRQEDLQSCGSLWLVRHGRALYAVNAA
jgi:hypothetical protein